LNFEGCHSTFTIIAVIKLFSRNVDLSQNQPLAMPKEHHKISQHHKGFTNKKLKNVQVPIKYDVGKSHTCPSLIPKNKQKSSHLQLCQI
jgi:hypothetical protein